MPFFFLAFAFPILASDRPEAGRLWIDTADFLVAEEDKEGLRALQTKALAERPWDSDLALRLASYHLKTRDRAALIDFMASLQMALGCSARAPVRKNVCETFARSWNGNLDSVLFFEDSAQKLEQARRLLEAKDCPAALGVLKEVESREGSTKGVLLAMEKTYKCLGDAGGQSRTVEKLKQIRMFSGAAEL